MCIVVASSGVLFEKQDRGGPGACLGDGQSTVAGWRRRRAGPAYPSIRDLTEIDVNEEYINRKRTKLFKRMIPLT